MNVIKDWILEAAEEIYDGKDSGVRVIVEAISEHCPMTPDVAYMPVPRCDACRHWDRETMTPLDTAECSLYHPWRCRWTPVKVNEFAFR